MAVKRSKNLLIELGTEELPPKSLKALGTTFADSFFKQMVSLGMVSDNPENCQCYFTSRRLALWIKAVKPVQPNRVEQKKGPSLKVAFDADGKPTAAALGFAKSCGVAVEKLDDQGEWLSFDQQIRGKRLNSVVEQCLQKTLKMLPVSKRMRWGSGQIEFVRPVHWLLALYGSDVLKIELLGHKSGRVTYGHRVHSKGAIVVPSADRYQQILKTKGCVISDYEGRKCSVIKQLSKQLKKSNANVVYDEALLDEVCGLVEWPVVMTGSFHNRFLKLPKEVLKNTMEKHQKYFPMEDASGNMLSEFSFVSNIKSRSPKRVREGNERVLHARLSDAEFFLNSDQKINLEDRLEMLKGALFHQKLGSIYDKTVRIQALSGFIATKLSVDLAKVERAALLCKVDLVTEMVGEFPDLQGVMGKYYAQHQKEGDAVAKAIEQHYLPRFSGDSVAEQKIAQCIAIADRIDTLTGIFLSGETPTGERDPFALRRAALGVLRTIVECRLDLDIVELIEKSRKLYDKADVANNQENIDLLVTFINERFKGYLQTTGYSPQQIEAVLTVQSKQPLDVIQRLDGVARFLSVVGDDAESLIIANKRIENMLSKFKKSDLATWKLDENKLTDKAENNLFRQLQKIETQVVKHLKEKKYIKSLELLSSLKPYVDQFFDEVTVMHEDSKIRQNRLVLLYRVRQLFLHIADISQITAQTALSEK